MKDWEHSDLGPRRAASFVRVINQLLYNGPPVGPGLHEDFWHEYPGFEGRWKDAGLSPERTHAVKDMLRVTRGELMLRFDIPADGRVCCCGDQ